MRIKAYSRTERKDQIKAVLAIRIQNGKSPQASMYDIAKSLDMSPSGHLMKILHEMCDSRELECMGRVHRPNMNKTMFALPFGSYELPKKAHRSIPVKVKGQMEMELSL